MGKRLIKEDYVVATRLLITGVMLAGELRQLAKPAASSDHSSRVEAGIGFDSAAQRKCTAQIKTNTPIRKRTISLLGYTVLRRTI